MPSPLVAHALRLQPGQDLRQELEALAHRLQLEAAAVVTCVGSLSEAALRMAGAASETRRAGPFEIVSLVGTLSVNGAHLHIALTDAQGAAWGGHLLKGCRIHTTAEIVVAGLPGYRFDHATDPATGYAELAISELLPR